MPALRPRRRSWSAWNREILAMIRLKRAQWKVFRCDQRFRVLVAGRRFGKTFLALTELCQAAWGPDRTAWYVAPTYRQAKRVAWKPLKQMTVLGRQTERNRFDDRVDLRRHDLVARRRQLRFPPR